MSNLYTTLRRIRGSKGRRLDEGRGQTKCKRENNNAQLQVIKAKGSEKKKEVRDFSSAPIRVIESTENSRNYVLQMA